MNKKKIFFSVLSGLLLTGAFPNIGMDWLAWFALVPLLISLRNLPPKEGFRAGFLTGLVHSLTLIYWTAYAMKTYGYLPLYLCIPILFLFAAYLALYVAGFSMALTWCCTTPRFCFFMIPALWVALEYIRSFLFSGFPWELLGYSQFSRLSLIQIADISGVYGVSFLIALSNGVIFTAILCLKKEGWQGKQIPKLSAGVSAAVFILIFAAVWIYGGWRIRTVDQKISLSRSVRAAVVQGNIDQSQKWDPAYRFPNTRKYIDLSSSAKADLIVWPETAVPFYFLYHMDMTEMVLTAARDIRAYMLLGSPSFVRKGTAEDIEYYNSAYLISPEGAVAGKYNKVHLVPFGEYVPFKKWLPFVGKIVEHVGDFTPGKEGNTLLMGDYPLGIQICYEIIFPNLSRAMTKNNAALLINITNDAWYGRTAAPYQHFSMTVFRAAENKRSLIRAANTGISGFVDPLGRIIGSTRIFEDAVLACPVPLLREKTVYTRFGDVFAMICLAVSLAVLGIMFFRNSR
jgi:apolipoprotein N-acyltransferase